MLALLRGMKLMKVAEKEWCRCNLNILELLQVFGCCLVDSAIIIGIGCLIF